METGFYRCLKMSKDMKLCDHYSQNSDNSGVVGELSLTLELLKYAGLRKIRWSLKSTWMLNLLMIHVADCVVIFLLWDCM